MTPPPAKTSENTLRLRVLQLAFGVVAVGAVVYYSAGLGNRAEAGRVATSALGAATQADSPVEAALQAATAGLSEIKVVVERNDTLDRIFRRLQFSLTDLANIRALDAARHALDRLRPGDVLTFFTRGEQLVGLVRPLPLKQALPVSQTLHVERDDTDQFVASVEEIPLQKHVISAAGSIESSLFAAASVAGLRDRTTDALADMFGWDIDFFRDLRMGDSFKLIYEQLSRDGETVADGDILAAEFINDGKRFRAVRYVNANGQADYYTPDGASLRKAFLKVPVQFSRISSVFNPNRRHPVLNTIRAHRGVDYAAPTGTPVRAAGAGRVQYRGVKGGFGNVIEIVHAGKIVTRYGHLSRFAQGLSNGQKVDQGQLIGYVGSTGLATGPHLHFEYIEHGVQIDPQKAIKRGEPGPPVPSSERDRFNLQTAPLLAQLEARKATAGVVLAAR